MKKPPRQIAIPATYMRGGTSKGVFFVTHDLPSSAQSDAAMLNRLMLRVVGSPDPYAKQMDGMGGATSSTSKVALVSKSHRADCDVDYRFGAVSVEDAIVDWSGNCGNLTAAVGPFAIHRGLVDAPKDGVAIIRIWQANIGKVIIARVPMADGEVVELGDFELDGVTFPAAEVRLEFLDPGADEEGGVGTMFPSGNRSDQLHLPGMGALNVTLINAGIPSVFVDARALGLTGVEMPAHLNANPGLLQMFEVIRSHASVAMGLATTSEEATTTRPHTPKLTLVCAPSTYVASNGKTVSADSVDLVARTVSMGKVHHAMTGTGAIAIAVAAAVPGTIVQRLVSEAPRGVIRCGHPSGALAVEALTIQHEGCWRVSQVTLSRSARRLMEGQVLVPQDLLSAPGQVGVVV